MVSSIRNKNDYFLNGFIWHIYGTLTVTTTPSFCGPGSNVNEGKFHSFLSCRTGVPPPNGV